MIPKSLSLVLKSAVVLFPLLAGGFLTFFGGERLYEANTVQAENWKTPFGFLAFSSTQLIPIMEETKEMIRIVVQLDMRVKEANVQQGIAHCIVYINFQLPSYDGKEEEEVFIGIQFPFRVVNLRDLKLSRKQLSTEGEILIETPIIDTNVNIIEENEVINSIFYAGFTRTQTTEPQGFSLEFICEWEGIIHREGFSTFACALPVALGVGPEIVHPYERNPNAQYVYYAETLGLIVEMTLPTYVEVKQTYPEIETMGTDTYDEARRLTWDINAVPGYGKATQLVSVDFEDTNLSETRSRLIFDSGLFMGLGVALILSGIHEAVRVLAETREKIDNRYYGKPYSSAVSNQTH